MALDLHPHADALAAVRVPIASLPLDIQLGYAESALEAAEHIWQMRARDLDAAPSEQALRMARWAAEDMRDAREHLEALRAGAAA